MSNIYRQHYARAVINSDQYGQHIDRMTREGLHCKSDIAQELAARDIRIAEFEAENAELLKDQKRLEWLALNFFGRVVTPEGDKWSLDGKSFFSDWRDAVDAVMEGE